MAFLAPLVLAGLAAVGAPILIHLIHRMRERRVPWAAMRFLSQALDQNRRRLRVEDLILLALRCLLVVLLILAFARPLLNPGGLDAGFDSAARVAVLILDQSASMGQSDGTRTRLDFAKAAAGKYLDSLGPGSRAAVLSATARSARLQAAPGTDLAAVRRAVETAMPSAGANDWSAALRQALDALQPFSGARREVVLFTDNQASAWNGRDTLAPLLAAHPDIAVRVVATGQRGEDNLAVAALKPEGLIPAARQPFSCLVEVANHAPTPADNVRVTLAVDNAAPSDEKLIPRIGPGASEVVRMTARFDEPGFRTLTAAITPDRLPADDSRSLAFRVTDHVRITLIESNPTARPRDRDGFFLANALVPVAPDKKESYHLKVRAEAPAWLETGPLEGESAVFLANAGRLSPAAVKRLRSYVENGGALFIFPGPATEPASLNADFGALLPASAGPLTDHAAEPLAWQAGRSTHPVTAIWSGTDPGALGTITVTRRVPLALKSAEGPAAPPQAIATYTDGSPAIAEHSVGKGRVILFSSGATTRWTNLPIHPNFVPLLRRLLGHATQERAADQLLVPPGGTFQLRTAGDAVGRNLLLAAPGAPTPRPAGQVTAAERGGLLTIRNALKPGAYRVFFEGSDVPAAAFAVQVDPAESDLRVYDGDPLDFSTPSTAAGATPDRQTAPAPGGARRELWGFLLLLAALVALLEMVLAHRFSLAK